MSGIYCPLCDGELVTDQPHQSDVDGYCSFCNMIWNIDWHPVRIAWADEPCPQWFNDLFNKHYGDSEDGVK